MRTDLCGWSPTSKKGCTTFTKRRPTKGVTMRVLGIVTARGGSKGILRKNIVPLLGKPLLAYTVEAALASKRLARTVLSTDDPEIAEVGLRCGAEAIILGAGLLLTPMKRTWVRPTTDRHLHRTRLALTVVGKGLYNRWLPGQP